MSPRRHWLPLLSVVALLLTPFALAPRFAQAATVDLLVDTLLDNAPTSTSCDTREANDGDCSLRQAIAEANSLPVGDIKNISFRLFTGGNIPISGPIVLTNGSNLPVISTNNVNVEAVLGLDGLPQIEIDGNGKPVGFQISGDNNLIRGLSLYGFTNSGAEPFFGSAIYITGDNNDVQTSYIGVRPDGTVPANKANFSGIRIDAGGTGNVIGGPGGTVIANYISGNTQNGVIIRNSSGNFVQNNVIGLVRTGATLAPRANGQYGVQVTSINGQSRTNTIGGTTDELANIIGGNGQAGIYLRGTGTTSTTVLANFIGIDKTTDTDYGNVGDGVRIEAGSGGNTLSGSSTAPLIISGNAGVGVLIRSGGEGVPANNRISGTVYIGTNRAGTAAVPNDDGGVLVEDDVRGTVIDGSGGSLRIAGNTGPGVTVRDATTTDTRIVGTLVGLVPVAGTNTPSQALPNVGGILVENARRVTLSANTASGNSGYGVRLSGTSNITLTGNFVGLSLNRKDPLANTGPGIQLWNARSALVGGGGAVANANYVAGNQGAGLVISGTNTTNVVVRTNFFGFVQEPTTLNFFGRAPNAGEGVLITGGARQVTVDANSLGGSADTTATDYPAISLVGDNTSGPGGRLSATNVATVTVSSNRIGWLPNPGGDAFAFPNSDGVAVSGRVQNINVVTNTIRFNLGVGVRLTDVLTTTVRGNSAISRNTGGGILAAGASRNLLLQNNTVNENGRDSANAVANPAADGIFLNTAASINGATIISNTVRANTGRGIALQGDVNRATMRYNYLAQNGGPIRLVGSTLFNGTPPDPDSQTTPNRGIDPPIVDLSFARPLSLRLDQSGFFQGYVFTTTATTDATANPVSACPAPCTVQVFRPDRTIPGDTQGGELVRTFADAGNTSTARDLVPVASNGSFSGQIRDSLTGSLLFIATDGFGNSSEYATLPITPGLTLEVLPPSTLAQNAAPGDTVTYTLRLRNSGTLGYSNLRLSSSGTTPNWQLATTPLPNTLFSLPAGATRLVTATLRLPTGPDPNVAAGKVDRTTIQIAGGPPNASGSVQLVTTVLPRPVILRAPATSTGSGRPQTVVPHSFTLRNNGNVTVTLDLAYRTLDPANSPPGWNTSLSASVITLAPGAEARLGVSVTVPAGALQNVAATTNITATVRPGVAPGPVFPSQTITFSAITRAELSPNADLFPDDEKEGLPGGVVPFFHTVENLSNGPATFCLDYFAAGQSSVRFASATNGFVINSQNCFTLPTPVQGQPSQAQIRADVTVSGRLTGGDLETVTIFLRVGSPTGESISDATVVDTIRVTGPTRVIMYLPLMRK